MKRGRRPYWTADRCVRALEAFIREKGRGPQYSEIKASEGLPAPSIFQDAVGMSCAEYCEEHGYSRTPLKDCRCPRWTTESIDAAAKRFFDQHGRYPRAEEYSLSHGLPSHNTFMAHFGISAGTYWKERFPMDSEQAPRKTWNSEKIRKAFDAYIEKHARLPHAAEFNRKNGLPTLDTVLRHTGVATCREFFLEYFPEFYAPPRTWDKESCVQSVRQFAQEHGKLPTMKDLSREKELPFLSSILRNTGAASYQDFCTKYFPEFRPRRWDSERCIQTVSQFIKEHGRLPRAEDSGAYGLPCADTFRRLVGESPSKYFSRQYPELNKAHECKWTIFKIREALGRFMERTGRPPLSAELCKENGLPSYSVIQRVTGTPADAFIHEWYSENYELPEQEETAGWGMQMM